MIIESEKGNKYEIVIGLEIHAQIKTENKLFSISPNHWNALPNTNISPVDLAIPGALPVLNVKAAIQAIKTGIAINATINQISYFDRKNYFYPDLPLGYQITQFYNPLVENGNVTINLEDKTIKNIRVERIHLEQDAGKSIHDKYEDLTAIDFNRAGVGLMEIVSKPDMRSPYEAAEYIKKIRSILRAVDSSDADMDTGSLRCDVNVSIRLFKEGNEEEYGTRCELKNLNSIKFLSMAIIYEAKRHIKLIEKGEEIAQETRLFDPVKEETRSMRKKENANDYRYFPDPDLPPIKISDQLLAEIKASMPLLPEQKLEKYIKEGLNKQDASFISDNSLYSNYFDILIEKHAPKICHSWMIVELIGRLNKEQISLKESNISPQMLIQLLDLIDEKKINGKIAKTILDSMVENDKAKILKTPLEIIQEKNLQQIDNTDELQSIINKIIQDNKNQVLQYQLGKTKLFGFFVGEVMKVTKGQANPEKINEILTQLLKKVLE